MAYNKRVRAINKALEEAEEMVKRASELRKGDVIEWSKGDKRALEYVGYTGGPVILRVDQHWGDDRAGIPSEIKVSHRSKLRTY